jgi:hypothetical protein
MFGSVPKLVEPVLDFHPLKVSSVWLSSPWMAKEILKTSVLVYEHNFSYGKAKKKSCVNADNVISSAEVVGNIRFSFEKTGVFRLQNNIMMELRTTGYTV